MEIIREMLSEMSVMRAALVRHFTWYYHVTPLKNVASIRLEGLRTHRDTAPPSTVEDILGEHAGDIIGLNPLGADIVPPPVQGGPFACLAIKHEALPQRISLDWSYDGGFGIAQTLHQDDPDLNTDQIFVLSAKRWGSVLVYDGIRPEGLRAYVKGSAPHDPSKWPGLTRTTDDMLQDFIA